MNGPQSAGSGAAPAGIIAAAGQAAGASSAMRPGRAPGRGRADRGRGRAGARSSRGFGIALSLVIVATAAVRLWPLLARHMLAGMLEYDEGVYYSAAAHLIGGALPYRDFVLLHPPGIVVLLAPFAALARLTGDPAAVIATRFGVILVASANVFLLMRLMRRWSGPVAAVAAGVGYAAWGGAAAAERTVLLEPLLGLGLLIALTLLSGRAVAAGPVLGAGPMLGAGPVQGAGLARRWARWAGRARWRVPAARVAAAGVVLGLAVTVKIWAAADVVTLAGWLLWRSGWRAAVWLTAAASGVAALVCLPFFLVAPGAMFHQVIADQIGRTQKLTPGALVYLHEVAGVGDVYAPGGAGMAATIAVLVSAVLAVIVTGWRGPRIWAMLAIVQVALVLPQTSYTYHYIDFAAPALAACAGITIDALLRAARRLGRPAATATGVAAVTAAGLLALQAVTRDVIGSPLPASLTAFLSAHPCAFTDYPPLLPAAGAETPQVRRHCANLVDYTGAALSAGDGRMLITYGEGAQRGLYRPPLWQAQVRRVLAASDAAVLVTWRPEYWTPATQQLFNQRFRAISPAGQFTLWILRSPVPQHRH